MQNFAGFILLVISAIFQNTIVTRINLLAGAADFNFIGVAILGFTNR